MTLHEIAQSLGIEFKEAKRVYEKNASDYSGVEISTQQQIQEVTGHSYTRTVQSYALTTEDAQFFVSGYNNEVGKAYRRYLIRFEKAAMKRLKAPTHPMVDARITAENYLEICALFDVPRHYAQIEAIKQTKILTGIDLSSVLLLSPTQDNIEAKDVMLEPTELAKELGYKSPQAMNKVLVNLGLQVRAGIGWAPTKKGDLLCSKHAWKKEDKSGYNIKWNLEAIRTLLNEH